MPIYEYQCQQCQQRLEKLQKMSDALLVTCPACGKDTLKKLVSAAAFRLKGSGWYETDFKKDGKKNLAGDDTGKSTSNDNASPDSKVGDSKPAKAESSSKAAPKSEPSAGKIASATGGS